MNHSNATPPPPPTPSANATWRQTINTAEPDLVPTYQAGCFLQRILVGGYDQTLSQNETRLFDPELVTSSAFSNKIKLTVPFRSSQAQCLLAQLIMFNIDSLNPFSSKKEEREKPTWDPNTLVMTPPSTATPAPPNQLVSQQPVRILPSSIPVLLIQYELRLTLLSSLRKNK